MSIAAELDATSTNPTTRSLTVAGLFAGIGGIELGLADAGHESVLLCENDPAALAVLEARFPQVERTEDVRDLADLPSGVELLAAGFPCQDLSQAGRTSGIRGERSGLVDHVFRLVEDDADGPEWLLLENVPFMLRLDRGMAMRYLTDRLEALGFMWAYRVVDARAFGLPQRRQRVVLLASRSRDPRGILFAQDAEPVEPDFDDARACGFYWTEGLRGLGWAVEGVPTLKGGSSVGIPSPPAIWMRATDEVVLPDIRDAERLQGFDADWTLPAVEDASRRNGPRWRLVGNAVSVSMARWLGERIALGEVEYDRPETPLAEGAAWPVAAWGGEGERHAVSVSTWPVERPYLPLADFLQYPTTPLSVRATAGFLKRTGEAKLRFPPGFIAAVTTHLGRMRDEAA